MALCEHLPDAAQGLACALFGFARTREISTLSAEKIVESSRARGQNDNITVVTIRKKL